MFGKAAACAAVITVVSIPPGWGFQQPDADESSGSPLLTALLIGEDPPKHSLANLPAETRVAMNAAIARAKSYQPRIPVPANAEWFETMLAERRQRLERALVGLVPGARVDKEAIEFASQALLHFEWEGFSDPPLGEAAHTEEFLQLHPTSVLRPALELVQLHRYRCAFEAAGFEGNPESRKVAAAKYVAVWERVSRSKNLAVSAVAREMDTASFLYIAGQGHPRR
jgi:hypothetical protein